MTGKLKTVINVHEPKFLIGLHSSSETFGVSVLDLHNPKDSLHSSIFPIGRKLSNNLFSCVEELLPLDKWPNIIRLAVATGPGGFTGIGGGFGAQDRINNNNTCTI